MQQFRFTRFLALLGTGFLLGSTSAFGQAKSATFAKVPHHATLPGKQLSGEEPSEEYRTKQTPLLLERKRRWQREGRKYAPLVFYHNDWPAYTLDLRPTDSVVYAAIDGYLQQSDSLWRANAWNQNPYNTAKLKQLAQGRDKVLAKTLPIAVGQYEMPFFRFNAKPGQKWRCYTGIRRSVEYTDIELLKTGTDAKGQPLFLYAVRFVPVTARFPAMQQMLVSPRRGVIGTIWYDYVCWGSATNCHDWTVQYGATLK